VGNRPATCTNPKLQRAGRLGGNAVLARYGREFFVHLGRRGGRPRLPELDTVNGQQAALRAEKINERRSRLPGGASYQALREQLRYHMDTGRLLPCGGTASRKGD